MKPSQEENTSCPKCNGGIRTVWVKGRKLQQECKDHYCEGCGWKSEPFVPAKRPIRAVKTVEIDGSCWEFEGFDQYGRSFVSSEGFDSKGACMRAAREEIEKMSKVPGYGKCTAIVWPPRTTVRGTRVNLGRQV